MSISWRPEMAESRTSIVIGFDASITETNSIAHLVVQLPNFRSVVAVAHYTRLHLGTRFSHNYLIDYTIITMHRKVNC
jgi:hypothetical protein